MPFESHLPNPHPATITMPPPGSKALSPAQPTFLRRTVSEIDTPTHPPAAIMYGRRSHESSISGLEMGLGFGDDSDYEASPCRRTTGQKPAFAAFSALRRFPSRQFGGSDRPALPPASMLSEEARTRQLSNESSSSLSAFSSANSTCDSPSIRAPRPVRPVLRRGTTLPASQLSMLPPPAPIPRAIDASVVNHIGAPIVLPLGGLRRKSGGPNESRMGSVGRPQPPEAPKKTKTAWSTASLRSAHLVPTAGKGLQRKRSQSDLLTPSTFVERLAQVKSSSSSSALGLLASSARQTDLFLSPSPAASAPIEDVLPSPASYVVPQSRLKRSDPQTPLTPPLSSAEESFWSSGDEKSLSYKLLNVSVTSSRSARSLAISDTSEFRDRLAEDFHQIGSIGSGAFSRVLRVKDKRSSAHYAVKEIKLDEGSKR